MDFSQNTVPHYMKLRLFLLQLFQFFQHLMNITSLRKYDLIIENRLQNRKNRLLLCAKPLTRMSFCKSGHCTDISCRNLLDQFIFRTGINTDLIDLFLIQNRFDLQISSCDLQIGKPHSLRISGDLKYSCPKFPGISPLHSIAFQSLKKFLNSLHFKSRTKPAGEYLPLHDQTADFSVSNLSCFQIGFQKLFLTHGKIFHKVIQVF